MYTLPEKPIVVLETNRGGIASGWRELWQYRDLIHILAARDVKVRYKQTVFGAAWAIAQPLFTMLVFTIFFAASGRLSSGDVPYPIFSYAGLLPWFFFSNAVTSSSNSLVGNSGLITKIYFPRMIIPIAAVGASLIDFAIAFLFLLLMMIYYGVGFSFNLLMLPVLVLVTATLAIGVGMWTSALNVRYRDVRYVLPFLIQLGLFVSGVVAPIPEKYRFLVFLNPVAGQIEAYRSAIFGKPFDWLSLGVSVLATAVILIYSAYNFRRMEETFADII